MKAAAEVGVRRVSWRILFLRSPTRETYLDWLGREFPRLLPAYQRAYAGRSHLEGPYAERVGAIVEGARARNGLVAETFGRCGKPAAARQLALWA